MVPNKTFLKILKKFFDRLVRADSKYVCQQFDELSLGLRNLLLK